ncbi:Sensory box sensor histidine kinase/response regulator [Pseudomonas savastanoi pv. phaseolicola]|uniref:PAS domain-containing hybrid sensor histidine kinase/response regulator n=1 Tax=Pseudomonas savastanoi TaxID=29438 RepID=UPI0006B88381|nr:PAS domain-containing protein [Pseudomonas savastanoi]KPB39426.1 Sensory box sensor histidine kinase/response regulator [Pseudomonas savastanoi pv. phaseolicola]RMV31816.1 Sensory box sensor histidine kinase/response regulator [Pseudomonas savastanoi pv. phaseolicola]
MHLRAALEEAGIDAGPENGAAALPSREARKRAAFDSALDFAMILTDPDGTITDWNPGAEQVLGWSAAQMVGQDAECFFTPEDRACGRIEHEMQLALSVGRASDERWHLRRDGQLFWASGEMMPLYDEENTHLGFVKILRDRTREHLVARATEEAQERYRLAAKATNDAIWDWDFTANHVLWNDALEHAYGHPLTTLDTSGNWWIAQIHPDDQTRIYHSIHAVIDGSGTAWTDEYRFRRFDDTYANVLDRGHVIRNNEGKAVRMIGAMLDMSQMQQAENALRQSEERSRAMLETIEAAFAIIQVKFDADDSPVDYRFIEVNPAFERQAGVDLRGKWVTEFAPDLERFWFEAYGHVAKTGEPANFENYAKAFDRFTVDEAFAKAFGLDPALGFDGLSLEQVIATVHPEDKQGLIDAINAVITSGRVYAHQYRVRRADGLYYWIEANGRVDRADDGTPLSFPGVLINVDERRAVAAERDRATAALRSLNDTLEQRVAARTAELMQAEEKLRQSQKMEAVGQLTGGLAHDFNNLLAGISGALELMNTRIAQGRWNDVDKYIVTAQGAAKRAAALTHRLLAFSRRQTLDPQPTDVNRLMKGMTDLIQRTVGPSIVVETIGTIGLWPTLVDASQLENALLNLCINARDAMPDGGRITIEANNQWIEGDVARMHDMPEGHYLSLCVTDTGTGMTPDVIAKAFDPFFTTKPIGQGTGLGLSMIYGFANQSGGRVRIQSQVGKGTSISLYLPRYDGTATRDESDVHQAPFEFTQSGETILIVDDEPTVRMLLTDALGDLGYTLIEAADSLAGLKLLRSDVHIDLLITDVGLPGGMNGRQMADAGREVRPHLKTLFITGYAENAAIGDEQLGPGMRVLTKPFAIDALAARVQELMSA